MLQGNKKQCHRTWPANDTKKKSNNNMRYKATKSSATEHSLPMTPRRKINYSICYKATKAMPLEHGLPMTPRRKVNYKRLNKATKSNATEHGLPMTPRRKVNYNIRYKATKSNVASSLFPNELNKIPDRTTKHYRTTNRTKHETKPCTEQLQGHTSNKKHQNHRLRTVSGKSYWPVHYENMPIQIY